MVLYLNELLRVSLAGTPRGCKILKAVDCVSAGEHQLFRYGKYRVMACRSVDMYAKVRKQERIVNQKMTGAIEAGDKDVKKVEAFVTSCLSLVKGYTQVIEIAQTKGLEVMPIDYFNIEYNGKELYVCQDEDMKALLRKELKSDKLLLYSMEELSVLLTHDTFINDLKTTFQATLEGTECVKN